MSCRCLVGGTSRSAGGHVPLCTSATLGPGTSGRRCQRLRLGIAATLAVPALLLSSGAGTTAAPAPAQTSSPVAMSSCGQVVAQCEVEIDSAALPQQSSVRLVDGPVSVAPSEVIGVQLAAHRTRPTRRAKTVSSKMLHAYFRLPRRTGRHWRLQITNRRHQRHSFALPMPGTPAAAL